MKVLDFKIILKFLLSYNYIEFYLFKYNLTNLLNNQHSSLLNVIHFYILQYLNNYNILYCIFTNFKSLYSFLLY